MVLELVPFPLLQWRVTFGVQKRNNVTTFIVEARTANEARAKAKEIAAARGIHYRVGTIRILKDEDVA